MPAGLVAAHLTCVAQPETLLDWRTESKVGGPAPQRPHRFLGIEPGRRPSGDPQCPHQGVGLKNRHGRFGILALADSLARPSKLLEPMSRRSQALTRQRFGKTIRLFAPLYLSNECINNCQYCGFSRDHPILRVTLSVDEVVSEARALREQGFRSLLLVAGEHPKFVSRGYLQECVRALHE